MWIRKIVFLLILFFLVYLPYKGAAREVQHITTQDGLISLIIYSLEADDLGRMWIGAGNGVGIYDGAYRWYNTSNTPMLDDSIFSLYLYRAKNEMEIGTGKSLESLTKIDDIDFSQNLASLKLNSRVLDIKVDKHGGFWVARDYGLFFYDAELAVVGSDSIVQFNLLPDTISQYGYDTAIPLRICNPVVNAIELEDNYGDTVGIWLGTDSGLEHIIFNYARPESSTYTIYSKANSFLPSSRILALELYGTELWIGTDGGGLVKYDIESNSWQRYTIANSGLVGNSIRDILYKFGKLWLATDNGISIYDPATGFWKSYTVEDGTSAGGFNCVAADVFGNVWFGSEQDGITVINRSWTEISENTYSTISGTSCLAASINGAKLYVSFGLAGLYFRPDNYSTYQKVSLNDSIISIVDIGDTVYVAAAQKIYTLGGGDVVDTKPWSDTVISLFNVGPGAYVLSLHTLKELGSGSSILYGDFKRGYVIDTKLYVLSDTAVYFFDYEKGDTGVLYSEAAGINGLLPLGTELVVFKANGDTVIIDATTGEISTTDIELGQVEKPIKYVYKRGSSLYCASDSSLYMLVAKDNEREFRRVTSVDGFTGKHIFGISGDTDNIVVFTRDYGALLYTYSSLGPQIYIKSYSQFVNFGNEATVRFGAYDDRPGVLFSYKLVKDGEVSLANWSALSSARELNFSGLEPGYYSLVIMAVDNDGNTAQDTIYFTVYSKDSGKLEEVSLYASDEAITQGISIQKTGLTAEMKSDTSLNSDIIKVYDILPHSQTFPKYVIMKIYVGDIGSDTRERLFLSYWDNAQKHWTYIGGSIEGDYLNAPIRHTGIYAVQAGEIAGTTELAVDAFSIKPRILAGTAKAYAVFKLSRPAEVGLDVYSAEGTLEKRIVEKQIYPAGSSVVQFMTDDLGTGLYILLLEAKAGSKTLKRKIGFYKK